MKKVARFHKENVFLFVLNKRNEYTINGATLVIMFLPPFERKVLKANNLSLSRYSFLLE